MKLCMGCMESYGDEYGVCPHCGYVENSEPEEANQLRPGTILHNKYVAGKAIGHGAFGVTYLGYDAELDRKVAIKEYMPGEFSNRVPGDDKVIVYEGDKREQFESGLEKFADEARRLAMFQDKEGIVQIYDCFQENNTAYLVMEYLEGITAKAKVRQDGKMSLEEALGVIMPILRSLKEVNAAGILHRDIAPDNIMLTKDGGAKLIDFGASRFATTGHSRSLTVLIKQGYAPVEQYNGRGDQGTWTDVYGLAATFYFLLTGKTPQDAMERKGNDRLKPPSKEGAEVKKNVDVAIMNAMNLGIEYRTKTMEDFEKELLSIEEVARVVEPDRREDLGKMPKWLKVTLAACAVLIVTFGVLLATGVINFGGVSSGVFEMAKGHTYVPTFVNQNYDKAGNIAKDNSVKIQIVDSQFSDDIEMDMVLSQSLPSGSKVAINSLIDLVVSAGREQIEIPYLLGLQVNEAVTALKEMGLEVESIEVDNNAVEGSVIKQSIEPLSMVDKGSNILLEYSNGNLGDVNIEKEVIVPDLVNKKYESAQAELSEISLMVSRSSEYSNEVAEGNVISQSVAPGTTAHQGDKVNLVVSLGKKMVNMPYVVAKPEADAQSMLRDAELKVKVEYDYSDSFLKGNVISQSVAKDTKLLVGTEVTIVVSMGPKETQTTQTAKVETTPEPQWSGWLESLPDGVTSSNHQVETKMEYRYQDRSTTTSTDPNMTSLGWTQIGEPTKSYSDWGAWSSWSDSAVSASETRETQSKTIWRYRDKESTTSDSKTLDGWTYEKRTESAGNWSEWTRTEITASDSEKQRVDVETREGSEQVQTGTVYHYYRYYIPNGRYSSYDGYTVFYTYSTKFANGASNAVYQTCDQTWDRGEYFNDGNGGWWRPGYQGYCSGDISSPVMSTVTYMEYRSRTVNYTYHFSRFTDWSGWSDATPADSAGREKDSKPQYQYRDRSIILTYSFEKWGNWSEWSETQVNGSESRRVETRTLYRYK
ncbi:MAG: PASTA domain-containing protein [Acetatifactor sp.]|nr:PASTA domain-containing protein [Acetatifactor sp.]